MVETTAVKAKACFTRYVPDYGIVHGDPDGTDEAKTVNAPNDKLNEWINEGLVVKPKGYTAPEPEQEQTLDPEPIENVALAQDAAP